MNKYEFKEIKVKDVENGNRIQLVDKSVKKVLRVVPSTVFRRGVELHFRGGFIVKRNSDLIPVVK